MTAAIEIQECPYCARASELVKGSAIYPHRADLWQNNFYLCSPCSAWVGCHRGSLKPLGRLANAELRKAKNAAHAAFDRLWQAKIRRDGCAKRQARGAGYTWLAEQMGIAREDCHIGMMDVAQCLLVVRLCSNLGARHAA